MSWGNSDQRQAGNQEVASLNPFTALLGQSLGIGTQPNRGGIQFTGARQ